MAETKKSTVKKTATKASKKQAKTAPKTTQSQEKAKNAKQTSNLIADNTVFELSIPVDVVAAGREKALEQARNRLKKDGFRQGKTPDKMVEKTVGQQYLLQQTLENIVPSAYEAALAERKLQPLTEPDIKPLSMEEGKPWTFEVAIAQRPEITVGKYQDIIKKTKSKHELWKDQDKKKQSDDKAEATSTEGLRQQRLQVLLTSLLEKISVPVPELLLRKETEYQLHELEHQLGHMNMKFEDFLKNSGKTREDVQQDYAARALGNLQVELLLGAIIQAAELKNTEAEISALLKQRAEQYPEGSKPQVTSRDVQYAHAMLLKQKALDHLLNL